MPYSLHKISTFGKNMGFKKIDRKIGFAELALASSMEKNRSLRTLEQIKIQLLWT